MRVPFSDAVASSLPSSDSAREASAVVCACTNFVRRTSYSSTRTCMPSGTACQHTQHTIACTLQHRCLVCVTFSVQHSAFGLYDDKVASCFFVMQPNVECGALYYSFRCHELYMNCSVLIKAYMVGVQQSAQFTYLSAMQAWAGHDSVILRRRQGHKAQCIADGLYRVQQLEVLEVINQDFVLQSHNYLFPSELDRPNLQHKA